MIDSRAPGSDAPEAGAPRERPATGVYPVHGTRWLQAATFLLGGLFLLALLYTLHVARPVFLPLATAVLLTFPLRPPCACSRVWGCRCQRVRDCWCSASAPLSFWARIA